MRAVCLCFALLIPGFLAGQEKFPERVRKYLVALTRMDTTNPPGNESHCARYLQSVAEAEGISSELLGGDPDRLNFVARLRGSGKHRPLLLMAHTDVVPADVGQWSVPPFAAEIRDGFVYGRGTQDDKSLLAAELAVLVEVKRRGLTLDRDLILMGEADEEAGSTGIQWLIANAWNKIDAEFALNEGGFAMQIPSGKRMYHIQTAEKIPTRVILRARGAAGHGSLPRPDNPVVRISRALVRLADADQPVRLNPTTRQYFAALSKLDDFRWLAPLLPRLTRPQMEISAANQIREKDPELDTLLRTTISPTMLHAGVKVNVIPNMAEAQVDIRRLPNETREEVMSRLRAIVRDDAVEFSATPDQEMPPTDASPLDTALYRVMEKVFDAAGPNAVVVPYMQRGATDGAFLRQKGMPVYGVPLFLREDKDKGSRAHGNDERIAVQDLERGAELLLRIVLAVSR